MDSDSGILNTMSDYILTYKNKTFQNEKVELDGARFENCDFNGCLVLVENGDTRLINCRVNNCKLVLKGHAYTIAQIINLFTKGRPLKVAEFDETGSFFPGTEEKCSPGET
jgi:hypothetical protein